MKTFLSSLLVDLEHRSSSLRKRVETLDVRARKELRDYILFSYSHLEDVRRLANELQSDPVFGAPGLINNQLQLFRRLNERISVIDWYLIPLLERFNEQDHKLTLFCRRMAAEVNWPLQLPVLTSSSNQYFWTKTELFIIAVPSGEGQNFLAFPGICHEMGHILINHFPVELIAKPLSKIATFRNDEGIWAESSPELREKQNQITDLYNLWKNNWIYELTCDIIAVFLIGMPYGWQYLRLCATSRSSPFLPALGGHSDHPASNARMQAILSALRKMNHPAEQNLGELWDEYLQITAETASTDYALCYPEELIETLVDNVTEGCTRIGLTRFDQNNSSPETVAALAEKGWGIFLDDPREYIAWEQNTIKLV